MSASRVSSTPLKPGAALVALAAGLLLAAPALAGAKTIDVAKRASVVLQGERSADLAGASVAPAGDVNGDG
ncbi:MAG: hypothetical protein ACRDLS_09185, partial [Solirubrobacteraceae bacterium]